MARVLIPTNSRTYNHNPRGSSTAVVTMKASNPFEQVGPLKRVSAGALPGMGSFAYGGMGDEPTPASSGVDWTKIATAAAAAVTPLATSVAQNLIGGKTTAATTQSPQPLIIQTQPAAYVAPRTASKMPWIIGGAAVLGLGLFLIMRKRK